MKRENKEIQSKMDKKTFVHILDFLSQFGGFDDLSNEEFQNEFWGYYEKERTLHETE